MESHLTTFQLENVFFTVIENVRPLADEKGLEIRWTIAPDVPTILAGDPVSVRRILLNLVSNVVRLTQEGSVHLSVRGAAPQAEEPVLEFRVQGTDVLSPHMPAESGTADRFGADLSTVKELVEEQGGRVRMDREAGKGSTFIVVMPFEKSTGPPAAGEGGTEANLAYLMSLGSDLVFLTEMVETYIQESNILLKDIKECSAAGKWSKVAKSAHKLRSMVHTVGMEKTAVLLANVENAAAGGEVSEECRHWVEAIESQCRKSYGDLTKSLQRLRNGASGTAP